MGLTKAGLAIVLSTLWALSTPSVLLPKDKDVIYNYKAYVKAGTHIPETYASGFVLNAKVHVQAGDNATFVKFTDVTYKIYNGILDHVHEKEAREIPLPKEIHNEAFKIVRDENGLSIGIVTAAQDKEFARNTKKAIASILQLDIKSILKENVPHAFIREEQSIYGKDKVYYSVEPHGDVIEVQKFVPTEDYSRLYQYVSSNIAPSTCDVKFEDPISRSSQRKYTIVKKDAQYIIKTVQADGVILYHPYEAKSDSQFLLINQVFELDEIVPIKEAIKVESGHYEDNLNYRAFDETATFETVPDITNGRRQINYEKLLPQVYEILEEVWKYLDEDHINAQLPNIKNGQSINRVQRLLSYFDVQKLKEVYSHLKQQTSPHLLEVYHHILPLVGTRASALVIKDLIVNKQVDDAIGSKLLENYPDNIGPISQTLIGELEPLIHLDESFSWDIRKAAILSFATVVHKSYKYSVNLHKQADSDAQKIYEKYVLEYVQKAKDSKDSRVQKVYFEGLFNLKLNSIVEHLTPALNGQWSSSSSLRLKALWAIGAAANKDKVRLFELFWPILANREEFTELRIAAYLILLQSRPSHSKLLNIHWYLAHDPNEEVYNFHYSYVKSLINTKEPCKQDFKLDLAQVYKYMQPPRHGLSSAHLADYRDATYGFGAGVQAIFINGNDSQIFDIGSSQQQFHIYRENHLYITIRGLREKIVSSGHILQDNNAHEVLSKIPTDEDVTVEVAVGKNHNIYKSYYFDKENLHQLKDLLTSFVKDKKTIKKEHLDINYNTYIKILIPTDLGIPALYEYLAPVVYKSDISISRDNVNDLININIDNRDTTWIHYRHGLSIYNPILDVWQGVSRYHSFDAVTPLRLGISINPLKNTLKLSWEKHEDAKKDVGGFRTHVTTLTFVKDDYNRKLLAESSPNSKEWAVAVSQKETRRGINSSPYVIEDEDNLTTGHRTQSFMYDTDEHIGNGSFGYWRFLLAQPYTKNFETPLGHSVLTLSNWFYYLILLPDPGTYGYTVRREPSHDYPVTNIDLTVGFNYELTSESFPFLPGSKLSTRLTYAVNNKEQNLKTWDVNAVLDTNVGHTVNNLKVELTRKVPGQKDYKVIVDGAKTYTPDEVTGHLNVAFGQSADGVKDEAYVNVEFKGERSFEQEHEDHEYGECKYIVPYFVKPYRSLECTIAQTTVRHYTYNVKSKDVPTEFKKILGQWFDKIKGLPYYTYTDEHTENIGEHDLRVNVLYPAHGEVDVTLTTPNHQHRIDGIPINYLKWFGVSPDSTIYSTKFYLFHKLGLVDHCVVHHDKHRLNHRHFVDEKVQNDWTQYVGKSDQDPNGLFVKQLDGHKLAFKIVDGDHILEVEPQGQFYKISLNGQVAAQQDEYLGEWVAYKVFKDSVPTFVAAIPKNGGHLEFDGQEVLVVIPKIKGQRQGRCYKH